MLFLNFFGGSRNNTIHLYWFRGRDQPIGKRRGFRGAVKSNPRNRSRDTRHPDSSLLFTSRNSIFGCLISCIACDETHIYKSLVVSRPLQRRRTICYRHTHSFDNVEAAITSPGRACFFRQVHRAGSDVGSRRAEASGGCRICHC